MQSLRDQRRALELDLDQVLIPVLLLTLYVYGMNQICYTQGFRGPDDIILASCLLLATETTAVTLLTDDINLANKVEDSEQESQAI